MKKAEIEPDEAEDQKWFDETHEEIQAEIEAERKAEKDEAEKKSQSAAPPVE